MISFLSKRLFLFKAASIVCLGMMFPCLLCTTCVAPDSPRFLLWKDKKTECIDSLSWLRGQTFDIRTEFTELSESLNKSVGSDGILITMTKRSVMVPAVLSLFLVIISSCNGVVTFSLIFVTEFSGRLLSENMMLIAISLKIVGSLGGLLIVSRYGLKMLLLLGKNIRLKLYIILT